MNGVSQTIAPYAFYQNLIPVTDNTIDIGTQLLRFKDLWLAGSAKFWDSTGVVTSTIVADLANTEMRIGTTSAHKVTFQVNNLRRWSIDTSGVLTQDTTNGGGILLGRTGANIGRIMTGAASLDTDVSGLTSNTVPFVGVQTSGGVGSHLVLIDNGNDAGGVQSFVFKTRSGGTSANTIVANADSVEDHRYYGADGAAYVMAARIQVKIDGAPASGVMPGRIELSTGSTVGAALLRWTLNANGAWVQDTTNGGGITLGRSGGNAAVILNGASTLDSDVTNVISTHCPFVSVQSVGSTGSQLALIDNGNDTSGVQLQILKTRSGGTSADTIVANGDILGEINFYGADGVGYRAGARIRVKVDGAPGASDLPARIELHTTLDGAASPTLRWTLDNAGVWQNNTAGNESVGANTVVLTNSPATAASAPYVWIKYKSSDGSTIYIPGWK